MTTGNARLVSAVLAAVVLAAVVLVAVIGTAAALGVGHASVADAAPAERAMRYIVQLDDPPMAQYEGGSGKLAPTAAYVLGDVHLDTTSPAAVAYRRHLLAAQSAAKARIQAVAPGVRFDWSYTFVLNGFAATLTADEVRRVRRLPGVAGVHVEERLEPEMDFSLPLVGAPEAFDMVGGIEEAGLNARVAIIDAGLDSQHPMHSGDGFEAPPMGYPTATMHLRDGTVVAYPNAEDYTNNKVIAARIFVSPDYLGDTDIVTALQQLTPLGTGHGLHTSGTAAGRHGTYTSPWSGRDVSVTLSGIAPMAQVLNYNANWASTPEFVAMMDQMVVDKVDAFNMSLGTVTWLIDQPNLHPMTQAFEGAADAGIVTVMSAGNSGANGATALSGVFKYSEKALAVGNTSNSGDYRVVVTLGGAARPLASVLTTPRGIFTPTMPIEGPMFLAPDGGCEVPPQPLGAIAVVDRRGEGTCSYNQRAQNMKDAGAEAVIFYYDDAPQAGASSTAMALPSVAIGTDGGAELMAWLRGGAPDASGTVAKDITRHAVLETDVLSGSSSQGPGPSWEIKPDLSAPGSSIVSSYDFNVGGELVPIVYPLGGTSMASPHVAGAATLLASAHPDWTSQQIRSALVTTSDPVIKVQTSPTETVPAAPYQGGPGRLNVAAALDPGVFLSPYKASLGSFKPDESVRIPILLTSASDRTESWAISIAPVTGTLPTVDATEVELEAGGTAQFNLSFDARTATQADHWGAVALTRGNDLPVVRLTYYARVEDPNMRKDALLVNWTWGDDAFDTPDYSGTYTETLSELGLTYDVWTIDESEAGAANERAHPTLSLMKKYELVVLNTNESRYALQPNVSGMPYGVFQYQNYLLGGGDMLMVGQGEMNWWRFMSKSTYPSNYQSFCGPTWPKCMLGPSQNTGCEMCLARYFAGFTYGVTSSLAGRLLDYPELPPTPTLEVLLPPHADSVGPFDYTLDISTGDEAKDGAAGNQYTFASGEVLSEFVASGETAWEGRDFDQAEGVVEHLAPYARPLWSYTGEFETEDGGMETTTKAVGTYVAGKHYDDPEIAWNAMFWGFGLEGVGAGEDGTVGRERVLGDAFNFVARNLNPYEVEPFFDPFEGLMLFFPWYAEVPLVAQVDIDWGDGSDLETITLDPPQYADELVLRHAYEEEDLYYVTMDLYPASHAAPMYGVQGDIEGAPGQAAIFLPLSLRSYDPWGVGNGAWAPGVARTVRPE